MSGRTDRSDGLGMGPGSDLIAPPKALIAASVAQGLAEDLGRAGDITTDSILPADARLTADIVARAEGVLAGLDYAVTAFHQLDPTIDIERLVEDGARLEKGTRVAHVRGNGRAILTGERVALNGLIRLSGIATATRAFVDRIVGTRAHICCTRKTTPGWRALEKYAVRAGGGRNHRFGLDDAVLIKDNHIAFAGGIQPAIARARSQIGHLVRIEVEVDTLDQLREVLDDPVDAVLLDNMTPETLREAVALVAGRMVTEASGGVTLETVRAIAETGVDLISVGGLTHSAPALDLALDFATNDDHV